MRYKRLRHIWNQLPSKIWWVYGLGSFPKLLFSTRRRKSFICTNVQVLVPIYSSCTRLHFGICTNICLIFSTAPVFSSSSDWASRCNEVANCKNGGWFTTEKSTYLQRCYSQTTVSAKMVEFRRRSQNSCEKYGKRAPKLWW